MGWPVRVFQNLIYLNKKVESDLGTLLTTPKSTQNENIRSNECQKFSSSHLSAVPPPLASSPWWWGDQAMAFTAATW